MANNTKTPKPLDTYTVYLPDVQFRVEIVKMLMERLMDPLYHPPLDALVGVAHALGLRISLGMKERIELCRK